MNNYAITGYAGSGKDTVGEFLEHECEKKTYALAEPIKELVSRLFIIPEDRMNDRAFKEVELTYQVDVTSLEDAGMYYNDLGLGEYQVFHDAWDSWVELFELKEVGEHYEVKASIRTLLQRMGTEWGRAQSDTLWLDLTPEDVIVTDIRFDNEAQYFIDKGYKILEVERVGMERIANSTHASEAGVCPSLIDTVIYNDATLGRLHEKIIIYLNSDDPIGAI